MTRRDWLRRTALSVTAVRFPARDFEITKFGAVGDGKKVATTAIRKAIAACHAAGGGRVVVPAGKFLTGPVHLESNVNLHLAESATLLFSRDPRDYLRWFSPASKAPNA